VVACGSNWRSSAFKTKTRARLQTEGEARMSHLGKVTHHERDGSITVADVAVPAVAGAAAAGQQSVEWHLIADAAAALQAEGSRTAVRVGGRNVGLLKWRCECCGYMPLLATRSSLL
jgi:hypothetical protein